MNFEYSYFKLVRNILSNGALTKGRNGVTKSLIGESFEFSLADNVFPVLRARQYPYKTPLGEFAAVVRGPKCMEDFVKYGCGYWAKWTNKDLSIDVDYGNAWLDFNGVNQLEWVANEIKTNPSSRRLIVSGWNPEHVINNKLSLPCCHYSYQFIVREGTLNMIWIQRSTDVMIGLPADCILAATWLIMLANETGLVPGKVVMNLGDTHIYEEHFDKASELTELYFTTAIETCTAPTLYRLVAEPGQALVDFLPSDIVLEDYNAYGPKVNFLLKD